MSNHDLILASGDGLARLKWEYEKERTSFADLLCFGTADMDYRTPEPILEALRGIVDRGHLGYPLVPDAYYKAIHDWLLRTAGWEIDARTCVGNNVGIYMSALHVIQTMTKPGDKITILTPVHFCFRRMINLNGRFAIECPLVNENGAYRIDYGMLDACLASGSKMLWLCNPHNPIGRTWSREELGKIAELCLKHRVLILSDDVYCGLIFPGRAYTPIASLSREISYRTVTLYSTSKSYNTTALRHSFIVAENPEISKMYQEALERADLNYGLNIMGIAAVIAAYNECGEWLCTLMKQIQKNHRFFTEFLAKNAPGAVVTPAEAAYFAWVNVQQLGINPKQLGYLLEQEEHMIVENGVELGKGGSGFIRVNLATSEENLQEGARRFQHFWQQHQPAGQKTDNRQRK